MHRIAAIAVSALLAGAAVADEPVVLDAASMDAVTAAGGVTFTNTITSDITLNFNKTNFITSDVTTTTTLEGLQAQANAFSDSVGFENAFVEADSFTQVDAAGYIAEAAATSFAAGINAVVTPE